MNDIISDMMQSITTADDYQLAQWELSIVGALKLIEFRRWDINDSFNRMMNSRIHGT